MKSARMLMIAAGWLGVSVLGCMQPGIGMAPPFSTTRPAVVMERPTRQLQPEVARPADEQKPPAGLARTDGDPSDSADPAVAALTRRIQSLSGRMSPNGAEQNNADARPMNTNRQPSATPTMSRSVDRRPVDPVRPDRQPMPESPVRPMTANVPVDVTPPPAPNLLNTPNPAASSEAMASPAPRQMPSVQPTAITAPDAAGPMTPGTNVGVDIVDIRPVVASITTPAGSAVPASPNQAAQSDKTGRASDLKTIIAEIEQAMQQQPPHPEDELRLRLLYLAAGMDDKSAVPVKSMDPVQAELLTAIVKTVASSRQAMLKPLNASPAALTAAEELRHLLAQQSGVSISRTTLVTKVTSFGDYEAISPARFKAGNDIHAYVYAEINNFRCEPVDGDRLRTLLGEKIQVFDAAGKVVWERTENNIEDRVRTPRHDFFIPFPVHLPGNLPAGEYALKVTIEDRIGNTTDQQRLSFSIQ